MANRQENKMTEHILFMIFTKKTSVLSISDANSTQEELSVTRSTRPPLHLLVPTLCAVFHFFYYLLPVFNDQRTISENRVFHTCFL